MKIPELKSIEIDDGWNIIGICSFFNCDSKIDCEECAFDSLENYRKFKEEQND